MTIRNRLTIVFTLIVTIILVVFSSFIYWVAAEAREDSFHHRMSNKAKNTGRYLTKVSGVDGDLIKNLEKNSSTTLAHSKMIIYNSKFEIIFQNPADNKLRLPTQEQLTNLSSSKPELKYDDGEREVIALYYQTDQGPYYIVFGAIDEEGLEDLQTLKNTLIIGTMAATLLSLLLGFLFSGQALRPISLMVKEIDAMNESNLNARVSLAVETDEIGQLASKFNQLLQRLQKAFELQRGFISNASHELRTPLTVMAGQLDIALMNKDLDSKTVILLESLLEEIKQLNNLSNGLLNLAQTEIDISKITFSKWRVDELVWQAKEDLEKAHPDYTIQVDYRSLPDEESRLTISGNDSLLKTCFGNIMDNGCKYSANHSVKVWIETKDNSILLSFEDNGIGIPDGDTSKVIESFYRSSNAYSYLGHGIGLSLSNKITTIHKGHLSIDSKQNQGTKVQITIPAAG